MKPTSVTLARGGRREYQVTYWDDGVARWDGFGAVRTGAWQASVPPAWFRRVAPLAMSLREGETTHQPDATIVVEGPDGQLTYGVTDGDEADDVFILAAVIEGIAARTPWAPLDTTGHHDLSPWADGVLLRFTQGSCVARALAKPEGLVVLAGSQPSTATTQTLESNYKRQRSEHEASGSFELHGDRFVLGRHLFFSTPSAAASVIAGSNTNGRRAWRDEAGHTWADLGLDL